MFWLPLTTAAFATPDTETFDRVVRALSARDPVSCETVMALTPTPDVTLLEVVDKVEMPPWAPMIAANCLLRHHPVAVAPRLQSWVTDPALAGFGRLTLDALDALPLEVALPAAKAALAGSDPGLARDRLAASARPELKALAAPKGP